MSPHVDDDEDDDSNSFFLMVLALYHKDLEFWQSIDNRKLLPLFHRRVLAGTIRRRSLQNPTLSVFWQIYHSGQNESLIQLCGFHKAAFDGLLSLFAPTFNRYTPFGNNGEIRELNRSARRKRALNAASCLGLVLAWLRGRGAARTMCFIFGLVPASCSVWIRFGKRCLIKVLRNVPEAKVSMPTAEQVREYSTTISEKYPALPDVWGAMDGLKLLLEVPADELVQNRFYNGWKCDHYVSNLFVFSPAGRICACYFNAPGTVHDSTMAAMSGIYDKIDATYAATGGRVVVDSAFAKQETTSLVKSFQTNVDNQGVARQLPGVNRDATSVRQLSEWGMRGLQGAFPRLKDRIPWEENGERKLLIQLVIYLYNYRAEKVGFNQIKSTYYPLLGRLSNSFATNH